MRDFSCKYVVTTGLLKKLVRECRLRAEACTCADGAEVYTQVLQQAHCLRHYCELLASLACTRIAASAYQRGRHARRGASSQAPRHRQALSVGPPAQQPLVRLVAAQLARRVRQHPQHLRGIHMPLACRSKRQPIQQGLAAWPPLTATHADQPCP
jgi:hypothetical protein